MAYTVLARKYRSRTFDEVIGQEPIATTLANAIKTSRIHHGYLFTGVRGTGKTSMARILAKSLNCLSSKGPTVTPCLECDACKAIAEGQDIDVIEIDAASNTGVDNIRDLRSNTSYHPARARFKIYIIDEVHMLSTGAFNALLKTLEEPPEHVKFILATTEIQKVPATIQSRCQRFNFRNIAPEDIVKRLQQILKAEKAEAPEEVVWRIARLANGSMRDALSILDQLLSVAADKLTATILDEILPPPHDEHAFKLLALAVTGDVAAVLTHADQALSSGRGLEVFCSDLIDIARTLMLVRACGADARVVDLPAAARAEYLKLAGEFELSQYVQIITLLEELRRGVKFSSAGRALLDAGLVRIANLRRWAPIERLIESAGAADAEKKKLPQPPLTSAPRSAPISRVEPVALPAAPSPRREPVAVAAIPKSIAKNEAVDTDLPPDDVRYGNLPDTAAEFDETPPPAQVGPPRQVSVNADQRARVLRDPLVQQVIECFDGIIVNIESSAPPTSGRTEN